MVNNSIVKDTTFMSPLLASSTLKPQGGKKSKNLIAGVLLTSLIDAFSILVIYLLMNFSTSGETLLIGKDMQLPAATLAAELKPSTVVKLQEDQILIEDKPVEISALVSVLIDKRKELAKTSATTEAGVANPVASLIVQADKRVAYKKLSKIIQASAHAGFEEIKFAVLYK